MITQFQIKPQLKVSLKVIIGNQKDLSEIWAQAKEARPAN